MYRNIGFCYVASIKFPHFSARELVYDLKKLTASFYDWLVNG